MSATRSETTAGWIRWSARVLLAAWLVACAFLVLSPTNAVQTRIIWEVSARLTDAGLPVTFSGAERGLNVLLFVPWLLLVLPGWPGTPVRPWLVLGLVTPVAVETAQALLPDRVASFGDVVCNVTGVLLGGLLAWPWRHWARHPR